MTYDEFDPTGPLGGGLRALEASAGTGKTFAITSTVLRLVVEDRDDRPPLRMDELLLVTFTRAATAELEERLRRRLARGAAVLEAMQAGDHDRRAGLVGGDEVLAALADRAPAVGLDTARARVEEALRTVDEATVTTIHGFCHQVLRHAAVATGTDPGIELDTDDERLVTAVVDDWFVAFTHDETDDAVALLDALSLTRDDLLALARVVVAEPDPVLLPELAAPAPGLGEVLAAHHRLVEAFADADLTTAASEQAKDEGLINGNDRYAPRAGRLGGRLARLGETLRAGGMPSDDVLGKLDPRGDDGTGTSPMPAPIAATPVPSAVRELRELRWRLEAGIRRTVADEALAELGRRREATGTASFADLLRRLDRALSAPGGDAIVEQVGREHRAVLVDEFQDTDPVQWRILSRLFGDVDVFDVVGDPKQAIYGWRGADLATYRRARDQAGDDRIRTMVRNFRSDRRYVDACNHLMDRQGSLGGVDYVPVKTPERDGPRLVDDDGADRAGIGLVMLAGVGQEAAPEARRRVAADVAEDVVGTLHAGWRLADEDAADGWRRLEARDCVVLVRRHVEAAAVADELHRRGVAVVTGGGDDVFQSREAQAIADLMRVLVSPGDERALRRLLVGPFVGLDANDVVELTDGDWQRFHGRALGWAGTWEDGGIAAAVARATREGGAEQRLAAMRDGDRTMTNLRHLTELLHVAEQEEALGTHALAAWFDTRRAEAMEDETPPERELRLERDDAAVRVVTVHASKGLEYPLVWVPFLWVPTGRRDGSAPFVVNDPDADHVRTVALHAASSDALRSQPDRRRLRTAHDRADWEAGLRLAYVALTRAVHRATVHLVATTGRSGWVTRSPAWQLLWAELGDGGPAADRDAIDEDAMTDVLERWAEHDDIQFEVRHGQAGHTLLQVDEVGDARELAVRHYRRTAPLDVSWARASYSGLTRARAAPPPSEADASDEADTDQAVGDAAPEGDGRQSGGPLPPTQWGPTPVPLADVPRGADWGTYVHRVLELADFDADRPTLRALVERVGRDEGPADAAAHAATLTDGLRAALATPLGPALGERPLADVRRRDRLDELAFTLTLGRSVEEEVSTADLAAVLERHAAASDAPLGRVAEHLRTHTHGMPVHGLLVGFIDLVLHADGRFWIADYKTNGLGQWVEPDGVDREDDQRRWVETEAHTTPDRVTAAMLDHDYHLQAHLYVVALHRHLRARLGDDYDYDTHMGGWLYLFLRGMTGPDVARDAAGRPHGIAVGRPTRALVEELDAVLRTGGSP